jgi:hypothetical protein
MSKTMPAPASKPYPVSPGGHNPPGKPTPGVMPGGHDSPGCPPPKK